MEEPTLLGSIELPPDDDDDPDPAAAPRPAANDNEKPLAVAA
jgi:hypothetical protein